jgi:type II secretory pathway pseudopilin PulG
MKKYFTLVDIVISLIILGILATLGLPLYNNAIENAKAKACEMNLKVLLGALEAYSLEREIIYLLPWGSCVRKIYKKLGQKS